MQLKLWGMMWCKTGIMHGPKCKHLCRLLRSWNNFSMIDHAHYMMDYMILTGFYRPFSIWEHWEWNGHILVTYFVVEFVFFGFYFIFYVLQYSTE